MTAIQEKIAWALAWFKMPPTSKVAKPRAHTQYLKLGSPHRWQQLQPRTGQESMATNVRWSDTSMLLACIGNYDSNIRVSCRLPCLGVCIEAYFASNIVCHEGTCRTSYAEGSPELSGEPCAKAVFCPRGARYSSNFSTPCIRS